MGLGIVVVEICEYNALDLEQLEELEVKYPEVAVMQTNCLTMCNMCRVRPYALINGTRVHAKTTEECMEQIEQVVQDELQAFYNP